MTPHLLASIAATSISGAASNHLLQSTLFACVVWLTALLFRRNSASVRHALWMAASVKFLVPFALLTMLGGYLRITWPAKVVSLAPLPVAEAARDVRRALAPAVHGMVASPDPPRHMGTLIPFLVSGVWLAGFAAVLTLRLVRYRRLAKALRSARRLEFGPEIDALKLARKASGIKAPIEVRHSTSGFEPGIFGIFRPVLVLPANISARVPAPQLKAIAMHELCHVYRRDNLMSAIHMVVEAVFWFHPLVWFIGGRLVEERERACDERVLRLGADPEIYSEGILNVCKLYFQAPIACVSGVTGSNLRRRIEQIMTCGSADKLSFGKKLLLAGAGISALLSPVLLGVVAPHEVLAQSAPEHLTFEVASIKPAAPDARGMFIRMAPGGRLNVTNMTLKEMMVLAWHIQPFQVSGGPSWIDSAHYDISAKPESNPKQGEESLMLQALLQDRFQLKFHRETKELPVYALVLGKKDGKLGPRLTEAKEGGCAMPDPSKPPAPPEPGKPPTLGCGNMMMSPRSVTAVSVPIANLIGPLSRTLGRTVIDKTGLTGNFDIKLDWTPDENQALQLPPDAPKPPPSDSAGASIFTAIQEQLGLKLESQKGPVEILIVDGAEKPTEN